MLFVLDLLQVLVVYIYIICIPKGGSDMKYYEIKIDERVYNYLKSQAEPFKDTPNSVLLRFFFGKDKLSGKAPQNHDHKRDEALDFPGGVPKALVQTLEVVYEMRKGNRSRTEATNIVAQKRNTARQTVIDKYCRQLNKKAYEIDRLLNEQDLSGFRLLLKNKFINHKDVINSFFDSLSDHPNTQYQVLSEDNKDTEKIEDFENIILIYRNKASHQHFVFVEDANNGNALFVTPEGKIKTLDASLFEELEEKNEDYLLSHNLINQLQVDKYHEFIRSISFVNNKSLNRISLFPVPDKKITEDDLIPHIIEVLRRYGGKAPKAVVDEEIFQKLHAIFEHPWYQELVSNEVPRWKHFVAWAKERAKHRGLIKYPKNSGRGYWELNRID